MRAGSKNGGIFFLQAKISSCTVHDYTVACFLLFVWWVGESGALD